MSFEPGPYDHDRIHLTPNGIELPVLPIDLQGLFDRVGITVNDDAVCRKLPAARRRRPVRASWMIEDAGLRLTGLEGRVSMFHFPGTPPHSRRADDMSESEDHGLWERIFPDLSPRETVPATWVDEEIVVLEGDQFDDIYGPFWDNYERNRLITVRQGFVVRNRVRHNGAGDRHDPPESPNWVSTCPYPPTLGIAFEMRRRQEAERAKRDEETGSIESSEETTPEPPESPDS
jgi:hypothetical protein